jgi:hypothetical protein
MEELEISQSGEGQDNNPSPAKRAAKLAVEQVVNFPEIGDHITLGQE